MKITVMVKPKSKKEGVEQIADGTYIVRVKEPPIEGRANIRVIELLSAFFQCPKSQIQLVSGAQGKRKVFAIGNS